MLSKNRVKNPTNYSFFLKTLRLKPIPNQKNTIFEQTPVNCLRLTLT